MCGIIGVLNKGSSGFTAQVTKAFSDLMFMNTLRGMDSSGAVCVDIDGNVDVVKDVIPGTYFTSFKEYDNLVEKKSYKDGKVLIGHNRKATIGKVNMENAHPFIVNDELVLVHNGSLSSHKNLADIESDSHAIAIHLHKNYEKELGQTFSEIMGAYALVWYDVRTNKLNLVRNTHRPLWMCETDGQWWWASEPHMLWAALDRNNLRSLDKSMAQLTVNKLYSMDLEKMYYNSKWEETEIPFVAPPTKGELTMLDLTGGKTSKTTTGNAGETRLSKSAFKDTYKHYFGKPVDLVIDDFVDLNNNGFQYYWYGTSSDIKIPHYVIGECTEVTAIPIIENGMIASGMVVNSWYDKAERKAVFKVILGAKKGKHSESKTAVH